MWNEGLLKSSHYLLNTNVNIKFFLLDIVKESSKKLDPSTVGSSLNETLNTTAVCINLISCVN